MYSFSVNFKGKPNPKDKNLVKLEMVLFKTGYPRVSKILVLTGKFKDWDQKTQTFIGKTTADLELNQQLTNLRLKYTKVAIDWKTNEHPWSPVQWSHYFDKEQSRREDVKVVTVNSMIDTIIQRASEKERLKNGHVVTSCETGGYYKALRNHLAIFTNQKYNKAFNTYYFTDITSEFIEDFIFYLRKNALQKGIAGGVSNYLKKFYGVFYYASKIQMPGSDLSIFESFRLDMKSPKTTPKTIPIEAMRQIENIDRSLLTKKEDFYVDLFLFSFYCGGIAPIDMCYLTWDCINENSMTFERMKTPKSATVPFIDKAKDIIRKHKDQCFENYVLPVFSHKHIEEWQKRDRLMRLCMRVNKTLKKVSDIIKYEGNITWYAARGTFITYMLDQGYTLMAVASIAGNSPMAIERNYFKQTRIEDIKANLNTII